INRRLAALAHGKAAVAVVEAALMYEAGLDKELDAVVVVDAEEDTKIARVTNRDGSSRESVLARMRAQMSPDAKLKKADYVVYNNGTFEELEERVRFLYSVFVNLQGS
ncbi:MAG TPA: dephospho-CoA kinase, partial [Bacteroidota bacterium]